MSKEDFAETVAAWANGADIEFRVDPEKSNYGSGFDWHAMDNPLWCDRFEYRIVTDEVERLNILASIHEGDDG